MATATKEQDMLFATHVEQALSGRTDAFANAIRETSVDDDGRGNYLRSTLVQRIAGPGNAGSDFGKDYDTPEKLADMIIRTFDPSNEHPPVEMTEQYKQAGMLSEGTRCFDVVFEQPSMNSGIVDLDRLPGDMMVCVGKPNHGDQLWLGAVDCEKQPTDTAHFIFAANKETNDLMFMITCFPGPMTADFALNGKSFDGKELQGGEVMTVDEARGLGCTFAKYMSEDMVKEFQPAIEAYAKWHHATIINTNELAKKIGNEPREFVTPQGETRVSISWDTETAQKALAEVYPLASKGNPVVINGRVPAWFASALAHVVHPCHVGLYDPKIQGNVDIPACKRGEANPQGELAFKVSEGKEGILVQWEISNGTMPPVYDYHNLSKVVVPEIPEGKPVYIDGKGPNYITVSIGEAYAHTNAGAFFHQPQNKAYVCGITHDPKFRVGDMIPEAVVAERTTPVPAERSAQDIADAMCSSMGMKVAAAEPSVKKEDGISAIISDAQKMADATKESHEPVAADKREAR